MTQLGIFERGWRWLFGEPAPREVWKTESAEFVRKERELDPLSPGINRWDVYALHQRSLTTGNTRIIEDWRLT